MVHLKCVNVDLLVTLYMYAGLLLGIDPRGGEISIYEKEGGAKPCVHERLIVG